MRRDAVGGLKPGFSCVATYLLLLLLLLQVLGRGLVRVGLIPLLLLLLLRAVARLGVGGGVVGHLRRVEEKVRVHGAINILPSESLPPLGRSWKRVTCDGDDWRRRANGVVVRGRRRHGGAVYSGGGLTGGAHGFSHSLVCVAMIVSALIGHFWRKTENTLFLESTLFLEAFFCHECDLGL